MYLSVLGELGGVVKCKLCIDPGGLVFGVRIELSVTGDVERANGETGVCFLLLEAGFLQCLSFKDSERRGEDESLGEGVPLELENE